MAEATLTDVPVFAHVAGADPHALPKAAYEAAFAGGDYYGKLRWQKPFPEVYRKLGWCSWNAYYEKVSEQALLASAASLAKRRVPVGYMLIDDGWLSVTARKLTAFGANAARFPHGLAWLTHELKTTYHVPHVGVWHAFQGYWAGVDPEGAAARGQRLYAGADGLHLPDPRGDAGTAFYDAWYASLAAAGIDFVKVDNQAGQARFTNGKLPLLASAAGAQRAVQEAARKHFTGPGGGLNLLNCMEMTPEHAYSWRHSNLARTSNDYEPDRPLTTKEHVFQNGYNAYWIASFAYPDYDMFVSARPDADYHAIARAVSGGPAYTADRPGEEDAPLLRRLALADGTLLMPDQPGQVTRDTLLVDTGLAPVALEIAAPVARPGYRAALVGAFNVNKTAARVAGRLTPEDGVGLPPGPLAVYARNAGTTRLLAHPGAAIPIALGSQGAELYTLAPVQDGVAVFGLLEKYAGAAAVASVTRDARGLTVSLREAGTFGAYAAVRPASVRVGGREARGWTWSGGLLRVPAAAFGPGPAALTIR
jgi:hypothetical protein